MSAIDTVIQNDLLRKIRREVPGLRGKSLRAALATRRHKIVLKRMERAGLVRFVPGAGWIEN